MSDKPQQATEKLRYLPELAGRSGVFADRAEAGRSLARLLAQQDLQQPILLAIPAGGVPVGLAAAEMLGWPLEVAVVSKILLPWNTEAGYGAVAWDGSIRLNRKLLARLDLSDETIEKGIATTSEKVAKRVQLLMKNQASLNLTGRCAVLVDDGLASGFTLLTAIAALKKVAPAGIMVAVPTGHRQAAAGLTPEVDLVLCANLRDSTPFAVAAAYRHWRDVSEAEVMKLLAGAEL